jgi:F-type H+-transporting ATPase subunit epsilon
MTEEQRPTMQVDVVSAERELFSGEATAVFARSVLGEIGLLRGHQPAVLGLGKAPVRIQDTQGDELHFAVHDGFLECRGDELTVLADIAELAVEIDVERAKEAYARAVRHEQDPEYEGDAAAEKARAQLRLRMAGVEGY